MGRTEENSRGGQRTRTTQQHTHTHTQQRRRTIMTTAGMTRNNRVCCRQNVQARRVLTRASAQKNTNQNKVESRRVFARNAALVAAAAVLSVVKTPLPAQADEIPEKLKKKICANNATAKICIK